VLILADENIPYVREAFADLGEVCTLAGRAMDADAVRDAELLLVRSITQVNADLLEGSSVRFVATATIGEDHIDQAYLAERGIGFSSAPGCNANSVGQYLTAALLELAHEREFELSSRTLGIIGHGNVGTAVERCARSLGMACLMNDPPKQRATGDAQYRSLDEVLEECRILTVHVPLIEEGSDPTFHLIGEDLLSRVRTGTIIINTSRGSVADGNALRGALEDGRVGACVLDVWEGEPMVDLALMANCALATPHIAGYSFDGKVNGTRQIYEAACAHLGRTPDWDPTPLLPAPECPEVTVSGELSPQEAVREAVRAVYDIHGDDAGLRELSEIPEVERAAHFDRLRKEYPRRREFLHTTVHIEPSNAKTEEVLRGLGFNAAS
jgi:erythronate-4-phosphate dehydrogenase